jgi:putative sulfotransferase
MLAEMLAESREVLMLSEFFVTLSPGGFPKGLLDGEQFWRLISTPRLKYSTLVERGIAPPELLYAHRNTGRPVGQVPPILLVTLPFISNDPDGLYASLEKDLRHRPMAPVNEHYMHLFELLCHTLRRRIAIERSGGSLRFASDLHRLFPDALFVHLYRNGIDCARSMSCHVSFRLSAMIENAKPILGCDPFHSTQRPEGQLPAEVQAILPETFDADFVQNARIDVAEFGRLWSTQIIFGLAALRRIPPAQVYSLRYEDLIAAPAESLRALIRRIGLQDGNWVERAARKPLARHAESPPDGRLRDACSLGMRLLGYA